MLQHKPTHCRLLAAVGILTVFGFGVIAPITAQAQTHHRNILQRHKTLSSVGAGVAAGKVAKHTGKKRVAQGGKKNFAQRHPHLTGAAAAVGTHHILKKH